MSNEIGKVQFNVEVSAEMTFTKGGENGKKGSIGHVKFIGVEDAVEGAKPICCRSNLPM
jgi:hypothetical protein